MRKPDPATPANVLLVEDNPADIRLIQEAFREADIQVTLHVRTDGEKALDFVMQTGDDSAAPRPDIILLDLNLPRKDGREVLDAIKSAPRVCRIPIIVLTTSTADDDIARCYDAHANCYLVKPMMLHELVELALLVDRFWLKAARLAAP